VLGVGAGIGAMVGAMFGAPHDRPARRMREYLEVLRPLLRGEAVDHHGPALTAVGSVDVPGAAPPPVLLAALGPAMLRVAGELADGTVTWMTGPRALDGHVVPRLRRAAAGRPAPRVVVGLPVCVTADEPAVRARVEERFGQAGRVPEYRAVLDLEGVAGPGDVAVVGDEDAVVRRLARLRDAGATEFLAAPVGTAEEQRRTVRVLAGATGRIG
jgi:F420-dependent oxidoreductase-like protein